MAAKQKQNWAALGLSLVCAGAGTVQLALPTQVNNLAGLDMGDVRRQKLVFRALGLRDLIFAIGFLTSRADVKASKRWLQVFELFLLGDSILCGQALTRPKANLFTWLATLNSIVFAIVVGLLIFRKETK